MREILFRGKRVDNGDWVEGDLINNYDGRKFIGEIVVDNCDRSSTGEYELGIGFSEVVPQTTGQHTGLSDKNEVKIFEGDIVQQNGEIGKVYFEPNYCTFAVILNRHSCLFQHINYNCEVVGNVFDNPELLVN